MTTMTVAEWRKQQAKPKRNRFGVSKRADRTWNGKVYASKMEMLYAQELDIVAKAGNRVEEQVPVVLGPSGIELVVDFKITYLRMPPLWVEVKGMETPAWRLKCRLWMVHGPGPLKVVKLCGKVWKTLETITPGEPRQKRERKKKRKVVMA